MAEIATPGSINGTHFQGPVMSGPTPGVDGATGSAQLTLCLQIDWSMGNFSVSIPFPGGSFLQSINAVCYEAGLNAFVMLGTQPGQGDIATIPLPAKGAFEPNIEPQAQLPLWDATTPSEPFTAWLNVSANTGSTTGGVVVLLNYIRLVGPWSVPATNYNRP